MTEKMKTLLGTLLFLAPLLFALMVSGYDLILSIGLWPFLAIICLFVVMTTTMTCGAILLIHGDHK